MPQVYIVVFSGLCYAIYSLFMFLYSKKVLKRHAHLSYASIYTASAFNGIIVSFLTILDTRVSDMYLIYVFLFFIELLILFRCDKEFLIFGSVHIGLHIVCTRNFSVCLIAIFKGIALDDVLLSFEMRFITLAFSVALLFTIFLLFQLLVPVKSLHYLLDNKKQLRFLYTSGFVLFVYQVFCTKALYYNINLLWFSFLQLFGSALILLAYYFAFVNSLRESVFITQTWNFVLLERQLSRQLTHYKAYERSEQTVRIFKHDYKKLISGVSSLLAAGENEKALALLEQMDHVLQNDVKVHLHYSSNVLIDATLQELANDCEAAGISFKAGVYPPNDFCLTALECSALFSSITSIASEECNAQTAEDKFIRISSSSIENWFTIVAKFSSKGSADSEQRTADAKKSFAYSDACKTAEKYGGFIELNYGAQESMLSVHLSFAYREA